MIVVTLPDLYKVISSVFPYVFLSFYLILNIWSIYIDPFLTYLFFKKSPLPSILHPPFSLHFMSLPFYTVFIIFLSLLCPSHNTI